MYSYLNDNLRLDCPVCSTALGQKQVQNGRRLARCRGCGTLLRIVSSESEAAANESSGTPFDWPHNRWGLHDVKTEPVRLHPALAARATETKFTVQIAARQPYPNLQCPYCEHLNYDTSGGSEAGWRVQQFCANCGADLKKECLVCSYPLYVLDHFCGRCRSDQERAEYEFEAVYWQRFNEGKRLATAQRWDAACRELTLFFGTDRETAEAGFNIKEVREARHIYRSSIASYDRGVALNLYHECQEQVRREARATQQAIQRGRVLKYVAGAGLLLAMGVWSALNLGAWWSIFILVPAVGLVLVFLLLVMLIHFGVGFN